jgi:PAS domain S-box-containing protein
MSMPPPVTVSNLPGRPTLGALDAEGLRSKVLDLVQQAVIVTDLAGVIIYMNPFAERLYGWELAEAAGRNTVEINVPEVSRQQGEEILASLRAGNSWSGDFMVQRRDGTRFLASVTDTPFHDERGELCAIIGVSFDTTERARAEGLLRRSEARFRALASEAPVGIFEADAAGRYVYFNARAGELLGAHPGDDWQDSVHPEDRERLEREWSHALAVGGVLASEYRLHPPDGRVLLIQGHVAALRDPGGAVLGHVGAIVDITENHFLRMQLALASRTASIGTLAASTSHEIERPLTSSILDQGVALDLARGARKRLLEGDPFDRGTALQVVGDMIRALEDAQADGRGLTRIVKQLASYAESAPGRIGVRLYDVVSQAIHWLPRGVTEAATIEIKNLAEQEVSASVGQIEQVIVNLVTNAAKATKPGGHGKVTVQIGRGAPGMARIDVIDRGAGIVPSALEDIFHPFTRKGAAGKRMGLGLAISHSIVASHAGTLTVRSVLGGGSTFRVELPAVPARA